MSSTQVLEITADNEMALQNFTHQIRKEASEGQRYGVEIQTCRVDVSDKEVDGFNE